MNHSAILQFSSYREMLKHKALRNHVNNEGINEEHFKLMLQCSKCLLS